MGKMALDMTMGKMALDMTMGKMALDITPTVNLPEVPAVMMERQVRVASLPARRSQRIRRRSCPATQEKWRYTLIGRHNLRIRPSPGFPSPSCRFYRKSAFTRNVSFDSSTALPYMLPLRAATTQVCKLNSFPPLLLMGFNF